MLRAGNVLTPSGAMILCNAKVAEWLTSWSSTQNGGDHTRDPTAQKLGKPASGPRARRGSSPFPGAILVIKADNRLVMLSQAQL